MTNLKKLEVVMSEKIKEMETYTQKADYLEAVQETLEVSGVCTNAHNILIQSKWDQINTEG